MVKRVGRTAGRAIAGDYGNTLRSAGTEKRNFHIINIRYSSVIPSRQWPRYAAGLMVS